MSKKNKHRCTQRKVNDIQAIDDDLYIDNDCHMELRGEENKLRLKINEFKWTPKQVEFIKLALNEDTRAIFINGPAGTSKTLLAVYTGLRLLNSGNVSEIMYIRSAVESSDSRLGYLPGSADEKLQFYNLPFLDKLIELLSHEQTAKLEKDKRVNMFPVNFSRGLNWNNKCVIFDEAQNSSIKEITTVLTRIGKQSRCFILADPMQTDIHKGGAFEAMFKLFGDDDSKKNGVYTFEFTEEDIMRSALVKFLVTKLKQLKVKA